MKRKPKKTRDGYKTHTCTLASVEQRINRFARKGWVLSNLLLIADDRVLLVFRLDSLGDVTTELQMRLQKYLDAYAKMFEMMSHTIREVSEANAAIIANMK